MIEIEAIGLDELLAALDRITSEELIRSALIAAIPNLGAINKIQLDLIAKLPYSPSYFGRLKPSGRVRAGSNNDPGYARDTLSLYRDLTSRWNVQDLTLINSSDLAYAGFQEALARRKGTSLFAEDNLYLEAIDKELGDRVEESWQI